MVCLCVDDGLSDDLVVVALLCRGDSFEEDLRCWIKPGVFMDLVELDDGVDYVGVTLLKSIEALRGAFFFSISVELNTKGTGEGGAGREMMDSKHIFAFNADP